MAPLAQEDQLQFIENEELPENYNYNQLPNEDIESGGSAKQHPSLTIQETRKNKCLDLLQIKFLLNTIRNQNKCRIWQNNFAIILISLFIFNVCVFSIWYFVLFYNVSSVVQNDNTKSEFYMLPKAKEIEPITEKTKIFPVPEVRLPVKSKNVDLNILTRLFYILNSLMTNIRSAENHHYYSNRVVSPDNDTVIYRYRFLRLNN